MACRNLLLFLLLVLTVEVRRARGFGVFGSSRRYGGTHRSGWAWTSEAIGHKHENQYFFKIEIGIFFVYYILERVKTHYILMSLGSIVLRPHFRRNYGGKKGIFNFFGGNTVVNNPPSDYGVDSGLISAPRQSDSSELPAGWDEDWDGLVPTMLDSPPSQKLTVEWPNNVRADAGNVIEVI